MVIERENLLDENGLPKKPLRLRALPSFAKKRALDLMFTEERIRLATLSDNMERDIVENKVGIPPNCSMRLTDDAASILFDSGTVEIAVTDRFPPGDRQAEQIKKRVVAKWCDDKNQPTENLLIILDKLSKLFFTTTPPLFLGLELCASEKRIMQILNLPVFRDAKQLTIDNARLETATIDAIMEFMEGKHRLHLPQLEFPKDYHHERALKCKNIDYTDGFWITFFQLLTMRHLETVNLETTAISVGAIPVLLQFWQKVDYDMFRELKLDFINDVKGFECCDVLKLIGINEVEEMFPIQRGTRYYIILSKTTTPSKQRIGLIRIFGDSGFHMITKPADQFPQFIKILKLINRKSEKIIAIHSILKLITHRGGATEELQAIMGGMQADCLDLTNQLTHLRVQFVNGQGTLVRRQPAVVVVEAINE